MTTPMIRRFATLFDVRVTPLACAIAAALGTVAPAARAQEAGLEEIVVSARYREENMQTTPIAISAFSGEELEIRSIENVEDIGLVIPNAYFRRNASNFGPNNTIGLRGLNQVDFSFAFEPTVGVYIDDVYHSTITGSDMDLIDLERVEVLRGPQGTLFGKNSIGGAIRLISKLPQGDDTGMVSLTVGDYDRLDLKAIGDFALVPEKLFLRAVGVTKEQEGYGASLDFTCEMIRRGTPQLAGIGDGLGFGGFGPDNSVLLPPCLLCRVNSSALRATTSTRCRICCRRSRCRSVAPRTTRSLCRRREASRRMAPASLASSAERRRMPAGSCCDSYPRIGSTSICPST